jgi:glycosyltransferase involved in cell wall biosynthesis
MVQRKIKVCQVITRMDWGGSTDLVRLLSAGLSKESSDCEVTLVIGVTIHPSARTKAFFKDFPGKLVVIPELQRQLNPWLDLAAFVKLLGLFRKEKFDIVHAHTAKAGFLARSAAFLAGCRRIVYTPHGLVFFGYFNFLSSGFFVLLERLAGLYTRRIVALTSWEREDLLAFGICPALKIKVVPTCIEPDFFSLPQDRQAVRRKLGLPEGLLVGMVGRLEPVKGPRFFIEAAKEVAAKFPEARFCMVGEGSLREELKKLAADRGLAGKLTFTGWRDDAREIISCLDILVLPSLNEAVGLVLLQAQAQGVPVVAFAVGGVAEALVEGRTGLLVPERDHCALAGAVCGLLANEEARREMGARGAEWVKGRFTEERMVADHRALYKRLMDGIE